MKPEDKAWRDLREQATARLRDDFTEQTLHACRRANLDAGWDQLRDHASAQLPPHFAEQTLRLLRHLLPPRPRTFRPMLAAVTAACCLMLVGTIHWWTSRSEEAHNLASWQELDTQAQNIADAT